MPTPHDVPVHHGKISALQIGSLVAGPALLLLTLLIPAPDALSQSAWHLIGIAAWMVIWWMTEAAPVPVTALLPIPLMPLLGIADQRTIAASYGDPLIFLFLGGFLIAAAMEHWNLHKRIALRIVAIVGTGPSRIVGGFMLATAFLSMWISNTATSVMMLAVGISMIAFVSSHLDDQAAIRRFGVCLMLGIAYSASIGGVGTLIGTPPNALLAGYLANTHGIEIDFAGWMALGIPVVALFLPIGWFLLCRVLFPLGDLQISGADSMIREELAQLGPMQRGERTVSVIFVATALLWILRAPITSITGLDLTDTSIALMAATALFVLPASLQKGQFVLDWEHARSIPWGVLLLFGGGLALAVGFRETGLAEAIGSAVATLSDVNHAVLLLATITSIVFLTEVTSNTATTATFLPILGAVALGLGLDPQFLAIPVALAASMAFMMPVATPPNAIVFSYEGLHISDMMKAGIWMNLVSIALIYAAVRWLVPALPGLG